MTRFRPCIDLAGGAVVQLVGGTYSDDGTSTVTNHRSERPASYFAERYREDGLTGGHVIKLGPENDSSARKALAAWPGGLQLGGGINVTNASMWLEAGASAVIVTSSLFDDRARFHPQALARLAAEVGPDRLVVDLSARRVPVDDEAATEGPRWVVAMDRWQRLTNLEITPSALDDVAEHAGELLVHAADVEGRQEGIDAELVDLLGAWGGRPVTYAGGARSVEDLDLVADRSDGRVDLTIGSALDLFGGTGASYEECVAWNRQQAEVVGPQAP
ncbi:MAG: phosphoribosylformimino-5-aminoimidazole carboxamide ribotide isomerase [Microthrixaceae bacterium]